VIEQDQVGEDIVDLMINRLRQLSDGAQGLIRTAAAIGNRFEISMLKRIYEGETADFVVLFKEILNYDFVYSNHEAQQLLVDENVFIQYLSLVESVTFNFVHDRIQQAAYKLKDESMSEALHLTIALALAESVNDEQSDDLFQIVNHVNRAIALVPDEMKVRFAKLNLNAGLKAKKSAAYNAAKEYLSAADYLLGEQGWKEQNDLTYQVRFQYLQTLYLLTEFDQAQQAVERVLPYCNVITRRIPVYITHMLTLIGANRMKQAADLAVSVLEELGFELDVEPERNFPPVSNEDLEQHFLQMENLPEMIDESALNGIRVLMISGSSSFFSDHQTFMKISYTMFRLTVEYGNSPYSPYAYALYALVCNDLKMYRVGYRYCQLAMTLLKRDNNVELLPQVIEIFNVHMRHYCDPLVDCLPDIEQGAEIGRDIGGIEFASLNAVFYGPYALFAGLELTKVQSGLIKHHSLITRFGQKFCLTYQGIWQGLVSSLCLEHNGDMIASGEFDEELDVQIMEEESNHTCLSLFYLAKGILNTFLQDYAVASSYMWSARKLIHSVFGMRNSVEILFYHCLVNLKMATFSSDPEGYIQQSDYQNVFADFTLWSELCPQNNQAKYLILEAQFAASSGKLGRAMKLFHEASQKAKEYENWLDVSLAQLGLIEIQTQLTDETLAASFVANCLETLQGWGAHAIGANLILRYPLASRDSPIQVEYGVLVRTQDLHHLVYQKIEMESLVGTLQIIANETDQTELSRKILDVLVSSSNATSGAFFSIIEAESQPELLAIHRQKETHVVSSSDAFWGSTPILNKVISTGIPVVLSDALRDEKYSKDKHIHSDNVRSVLCAPMYRAKQIIGVIYLENNLLPNLFNAQQLEFIDLLIKQSVSALVNAQLYTLLKLEVEEKTAAESSLADLNKNLENKVEKRTIALKNANNELESSITRLKETQNKLVQSEKMASLGGLVAGVAHEINTPIGSALGASSFLVKRVEVIQDKYQNGTLTQKDFEALLTASAESMEIVNGNLLRAAELIRSFKRVAVDQSHEHIQHFDLIEVCRDVISSLRPKYKHLSLEFEWLGDPIVVVNHNPGVIGQIVTNLVMNSIHHGFDGAETGKITISTNLLDDKVTLGYRDNGKGMSEEVKSRIFEPFFTTTRGVGGSGLGMHIVFNLVTQKLNGEIQVVGSEESIGASFVISFPKSVID
jgi:signal transduction histidine kinase